MANPMIHLPMAVDPFSLSTLLTKTKGKRGFKDHLNLEMTEVGIRFVALSGCSASGKSTLAHRLNQKLNAHVVLNPISTDLFFIGEKCTELGTYEDPRCIDWGGFLEALQLVEKALLLFFQDPSATDWYKGLPVRLHGLIPGNVTACDGCGSDDSLQAHLEADASILAHEGDGAQSDPSATAAAPATYFVVCEGISVLYDLACCRYFSHVVFVECDAETACLRRFSRVPRRKRKETDTTNRYKQRIGALWESRQEERRQDLLAAGEGTVNTTLLAPNLYYPPTLSTNDTLALADSQGEVAPPWWDPSSSNPNALFLRFWELLHTAWQQDETALEWCAWKEEDREYVRAALATGEELDPVVWWRYGEFRYWYYFEVLYFHYLYHPVQDNNATTVGEQRNNFVFTVSNGRENMSVEEDLSSIALQIQST
ncbi:hypothetical protein AGDE_14168 [Angomonas deanei]|uniref:Uncharacterized protein n=1 Tax=Angomonas deanei TaxID=59799 RepID=A0A7G2C1S4_9TRYP|nr:hypothetical protein AGDE_14168 [Angomonas deanei]CAD2212697.1 hypothetical protein, conserved [Angomonas deanei]|eukprot:EPY21313.1 hypothetical protein AGDE_14168 [Angomonas deanei]